MLPISFFDRPASTVAQDLIGKVFRKRYGNLWLSAAVVEAEAYGSDRGNHASLGRIPAREAMWSPPGTIYMYLSQGGDSFNICVQGEAHVVLIKGARPWLDHLSNQQSISVMHTLNPAAKGQRPFHKLLAGQALFARALGLKLSDWNGHHFDQHELFIEDVGYRPVSIIQCRRLGLPKHREPDLMLRYVDEAHVRSATQNPLGKRDWQEGTDYHRIRLDNFSQQQLL